MEFLRKLRWVLYPSVFLTMFLVGSYCSFPKDVLQDIVETSIVRAVAEMNPQSQSTPKVILKDVSLWRLLGINMQDLKLTWPTPKNGAPFSIEFDSLKAKVGLFALMTGRQNVLAQGKLYDGQFETQVNFKKQKELKYFRAEVNKINFAKMSFIEPAMGSPLAGILDVLVKLDANTDILTDGTGNIDITIKQGAFGPGFIKMPPGSFLPELGIPKIMLGDFTMNLALEKGQINSKKFELLGGDLQGEITLNVVLNKRFAVSKVDGTGWFSLKKDFINNNETIKMLFDLVPELKEASVGDGKIPFSIRGSLKSPQFSLGASAGLSDNKARKHPGAIDG